MTMDGYQMLGNAVVLRAAKDYRKVLRALHFDPNNRKAKKELRNLEDFFYGDRIKIFTRLNGARLAEAIERVLIENNYEIDADSGEDYWTLN